MRLNKFLPRIRQDQILDTLLSRVKHIPRNTTSSRHLLRHTTLERCILRRLRRRDVPKRRFGITARLSMHHVLNTLKTGHGHNTHGIEWIEIIRRSRP